MPSIKDKLIKTKSPQVSTELPQFSRNINAKKRQALNFSLKSLVFVAILTFFLINFVGVRLRRAPLEGSSDPPLRENLLTNPNNPENYRLLSGEFLRNHDLAAAVYFNDLGLSLFPTSLPLLQQKDEIYYLANEPRFLAAEIPVWKNVVNCYPDYRDGYARLMWLNLKLGRTNEAKKYNDIVRSINPNWQPLEHINL